MTKKHRNIQYFKFPLILVGGVFFATLIYPNSGHAVYSEPSLSAPAYDTTQIPELLNGTGIVSTPTDGDTVLPQQKFGSLQIGPNGTSCTVTGPDSNNLYSYSPDCSKLCLNPNLTTYPGTSDPGHCIASWDEIKDLELGKWLRKFDGTTLSTTTKLPPFGNPPVIYNPDLSDHGYVAWHGVKSPVLNNDLPTNLANIPPVNTGQLFSYIASVPAGTPNTAAGTFPLTAIYAEALAQSNYAAQFFGTLAIMGVGTAPPRLCLNDRALPGGSATDCINRWSDIITNQHPELVLFQNLQTATTITANTGRTATNGVLVSGSAVAGLPVLGTQKNYSCGDNICQTNESSNNSSPNYCSADCKQ